MSNSSLALHDAENKVQKPEENSDNMIEAKDQESSKEQGNILPDETVPVEPLTDQERQLLFDKGIKFKKNGNFQHALHCLLACVRGLKDGSSFQMLPECLHNIADIYSQLEDYENAVLFVQAEKLYYETFLINVSNETQKEHASGVGSTSTRVPDGSADWTQTVSGSGVSDPQGTTTEARSANEYENLAHMCLKKKDAQLALEYCGKVSNKFTREGSLREARGLLAVKLRQSLYGEDHPITKRTLDLFTVIYAEMGKEQYSAALQKFNESKQSGQAEQQNASSESAESAKQQNDVSDEALPDKSPSQTSRGSSGEEQAPNTSVTPENDHQTVSVTPGQAMLLFFVLTVAVAIGVTLFCCHITGTDYISTYRYIVTRFKFYYYYYFTKAPGSGRYF